MRHTSDKVAIDHVAIGRLEINGGWPGIQEPLWAYLRGEARAGTIWFYREEQAIQSLVACIAP
jgi:hypothetical protein